MILRAAGLKSTLPRAASRLRAGFTLLEILLATLIAVLLLAALYTALNVTLQQVQTSRDAVEVEDLARGVFNKVTVDLNGTLAPLPPKSGGNSAASGGPTSTPSAGTTPSSGSTSPATSTAPTTTTPSTTTPADGTTDPAAPGATDNATAFTAAPMFQGGVVGQEQLLVLFLGKTPEAFGRYGENSQQVRSDQRQVVYKFVSGRGLYRAERPWVTADNLTMDLDPDSPDSVLLAEEVTDLLWEYSDGSTWANSWDGTVPGPDGVTPLGPPRAVRLTLTLAIPSGKGELLTRQVSQTIVIRSAPGTYTPPLLEAPTDGASDAAAGGSSTPSTGSSTPSTGGSTPSSGTGSSTPSVPSGGSPGGKTPSIPSGASMPSVPSGGSTPSIPSGGSKPSIPSGGGKTGGSPGGSTGGSKGGGK